MAPNHEVMNVAGVFFGCKTQATDPMAARARPLGPPDAYEPLEVGGNGRAEFYCRGPLIACGNLAPPIRQPCNASRTVAASHSASRLSRTPLPAGTGFPSFRTKMRS